MSVFKCKMCGGTIEFEQGATVGVCDSCGTKQTLPRIDDDRRANLYDRASHLRRNNEFDKAMDIYEQILAEDGTDAEAYWSLVLCRYGIEYVEDPTTHKRVPTVNRAQFTSIFDDDNCKSALQYADGYQREIYEEEAKAINDIQKGILAISQKEEPFDVFICYKETDKDGRRTHDSVLATDLYHQLTIEGFKVFFSRITLEDKLGTAYEPYIFAALNSAKVMVVLGTKPEYFNAVWVKNEWSRYLALVKNSGGKKTLIPAYRDMDPYDLPEEFSHLQAQDMSKLGFMQDLIRGIRKIVSADAQSRTVKETVVVETNNTAAAPLLERVFLFLEDGKWNDANIYCEKVLDIDPKNAEAYLGKLMAELQVKKRERLADCEKPFDDRDNFGKVIRFGDEKLESEMRGYITHINERNENARLLGIYNSAANAAKSASTEDEYRNAAAIFKTIANFRDASERAQICLENAENCRKNSIYLDGRAKMSLSTIESCTQAAEKFESIRGYKDADILIDACRRRIDEIKAKAEADRLEMARRAEERRIAAEKKRRKIKKILAVALLAACVLVAFLILLNTVIIPNIKYNSAVDLCNAGKYEEAMSVFGTLNGYKDSEDKIKECGIAIQYQSACTLMDSGKYEDALAAFDELHGYSNSEDKIKECNYQIACSLMSSGKYEEAIESFEKSNGYSNSEDKIKECENAISYQSACTLMDSGKYEEAIAMFEKSNGYSDSENKINECGIAIQYQSACTLMDSGKYEDALAAFDKLHGYSNSEDKIKECNYQIACSLMSSGKYEEAIESFEKSNGYSNSEDKIKECENAISYQSACTLMDSGKYEEAIAMFKKSNGYNGCVKKIVECRNAISYQSACTLMDSGKYEEAIASFEKSNGYSDSTNKIDECYVRLIGKEKYEKYKKMIKAEVNQTITFGAYEQDNNTANGKEEIEWIVLEKEGTKILVISKYALDYKYFYDDSYDRDITWETCSLRKWLNKTFLNSAFSTAEQKMIQSTMVITEDNPLSGRDGGNITTDKIFLLSIAEYTRYTCICTELGICEPTAYAGSFGNSWILRTPGEYGDEFCQVEKNKVDKSGAYNGYVRPALWINYNL